MFLQEPLTSLIVTGHQASTRHRSLCWFSDLIIYPGTMNGRCCSALAKSPPWHLPRGPLIWVLHGHLPSFSSCVSHSARSLTTPASLPLSTPLFSNSISFHNQSVFGFCSGSRANRAVSHQPSTSDPFYYQPFTLFLYLVHPDYFRRRESD